MTVHGKLIIYEFIIIINFSDSDSDEDNGKSWLASATMLTTSTKFNSHTYLSQHLTYFLKFKQGKQFDFLTISSINT